MGIDFRIAGSDIRDRVQKLKAQELRYDVILVDPWHEYASSCQVIDAALHLVAEGGTIVVHDCLPPNEGCASPTHVPGEWCGVTYKAYLDCVLSRDDITYQTLDVDYGCGIIRKRGFNDGRKYRLPLLGIVMRLFWAFTRRTARAGLEREPNGLEVEWRRIGNEFDLAFAFLHKNKRALLNLISVRQFRRFERRRLAVH